MIYVIAPNQAVGMGAAIVDWNLLVRGKGRTAEIITRSEHLRGRRIYTDDEIRWVDSHLWDNPQCVRNREQLEVELPYCQVGYRRNESL